MVSGPAMDTVEPIGVDKDEALDLLRQITERLGQVAALQRRLAGAVGLRLAVFQPQDASETAADAVMRVVRQRGTVRARAVAFALGVPEPVIRQRLKRAVVAGKVRRVGRGQYAA